MRNQFLILAILLFCIGSAQATIVYQEDFEDGYANGITDLTGTWAVAENGLKGSVYGYHTGVGHNSFTLDSLLSNNIAVDIDFSIEESVSDFEIWLNATIDNSLDEKIESGYIIEVQPIGGDNAADRITRIDPVNGNVFLSTHVEAQFLVGSENHLCIERDGDLIRVILNDSLYLEATDSTFQNGMIGCQLFDKGVVDNITVTTIPEPVTFFLLGFGSLGLLRRHRA